MDYTAFDGLDYVALGHIHAAYPIRRYDMPVPRCVTILRRQNSRSKDLFS